MSDKANLTGFREYTAHELARALLAGADEPLEVALEDPTGKLIAGCLTMFRLGTGNDIDRVGVYSWPRLTVRQEPYTEPLPPLKVYHVRDLPVGASEHVWLEGLGSKLRTVVDRQWDGRHETDVRLTFDDGTVAAHHPCNLLHAYPPPTEESDNT